MNFNSRAILSLCLTGLFFAYTFNGILIYADYYVNRGFIADVLCVNKAKPQMHCNGHCYLEKQLEKDSQGEVPLAATKQINEIQLFSDAGSGHNFSEATPDLKTNRMNFYLFPVTEKHPGAIFRPPCV